MRALLVLAGLLVLITSGCDENQRVVDRDGVVDRDNTAINDRDAGGGTQTPFDQSNDQADIDQVAEIRAQVLEINDLSVNGRNVKIITNHGKVVLRGPVASTAERESIVAVATKIAGAGNVTDQLEVKTN